MKQEPCYFYNTGGCYHKDGREKTQKECQYLHIKLDSPMERPQHLKTPCRYYHLSGHCKNPYCRFGHSELPRYRWYRFFDSPYLGRGYSQACVWDRLKTEDEQIKETILRMIESLLNDYF